MNLYLGYEAHGNVPASFIRQVYSTEGADTVI